MSDPTCAEGSQVVARLTVVLPVLNGAGTIADQLAALATQDHDAFEVLVVDNGSTDATVTVVEGFLGRVPRLRIVTEPMRGRHHACNRGFEVARAARVVFVDADDVVQPGYLSAMDRALERADVAVGRIDLATLNDGVPDRRLQGPDLMMEGFGFLPFAPGGAMGAHVAALRAVGGFRMKAHACEDVDLSWRLQLNGFRFVAAEGAEIAVRLRPDLRSTFRQHHQFGIARVWLYREYRAAGMHRRPFRVVLDDWLSLMKSLPFLKDLEVRDRWIRRLARATGFIRGSVRWRRLYL